VRVCRLLRRQGFDATAADLSCTDPVAEESPMLAGISSASIEGRIALGPRAGRRVWRVGEEPDARWVLSSPRRHAHIAGFDLHANLAVPAADRARLEQLCRYLLRPPVAPDRLQRLDDDRILLTLKTAWADGTRHLLFAPMELLEKLAALTPRPRINLILYHGVLAPHARWRARVVAYGSLPETAAAALNVGRDSDDDTTSPAPPRHWAWANLMRRAFDIDVLACPRCGGRLRLLGTIEDPVAIRAILDSLAMSDALLDRPPPAAAMEPAALATQV
jgi:Putative transposase